MSTRKDVDDLTPLSLAAANGNKGVLNILLAQHDISVDSKDVHDLSLSLAAANGHMEAENILLAQQDIDMESMISQV